MTKCGIWSSSSNQRPPKHCKNTLIAPGSDLMTEGALYPAKKKKKNAPLMAHSGVNR